MKTLMILCAGNKSLNGWPVYLCTHPDGKLLAEKCIEGIFPENYSKVVYVILEEDCIKYQAEERIKKGPGMKYPVEIIRMKEKTSGPAETVYCAIKQSKLTGAVAVRDCLNGIRITEDGYGNYAAGLDLTAFDGDVLNLRSKSFIIKNEQGQILDIIEKKFRSDIISVGLYGFSSVEDFCFAYERLNDQAYPIDKLYVSHIISYLIGYKQMVFHCLSAIDHDDWGSEESWEHIKRNWEVEHGEKQANKLIMVDLDGTLFDTSRVNYLSYLEAMKPYGYSIEYEYYREHCNGRYYLDFLPEIITNEKDVLEEIHTSKKTLYKKYVNEARLNFHLADLLRLSHGEYQIALVTTASRKNAMQLLKQFHIEDLFDVVITQEDVTKRKPDPEAFLVAIERAGCNPEDCIIFEDSDEGLAAASRIGVNIMMIQGFR